MFNSYPDEDREARDDKLASAPHMSTTPHRSAKPGEIITIGTYPQTVDGTDTTPIRWRVLQNSGTGTELFILSEYILDCKRYHAEYDVRPALRLNLVG